MNSEIDSDAAAHGAGSLDEIDGLAVLAHNRHVALRQQVAQVEEHFHVSGQEAQGWNGLADEKIQIRIALSGGRVEHIHGSKSGVADPAIRGNPTGMRPRNPAFELGSESV